jgi:imidazoleglycerol phosphate synthase glutamine amidotransferase subunit HisH
MEMLETSNKSILRHLTSDQKKLFDLLSVPHMGQEEVVLTERQELRQDAPDGR